MPRKRKTPSREELRRLARRARVAERWMNGASAIAIAKAERISTAAVYTDLRAASDVILPAGTKEQLLARNYERLESVIRANRAGMEKGDDIATRNVTKAIAEQNRMLGVNGTVNNNFMVNAGQPGDGNAIHPGINVQFPTTVTRPDGTVWSEDKCWDDDPLPEPPRQYAYPRLLEYKPSDPAPFPPDAPSTNPPSNPEPPSGPRTEFELPLHQRFGFNASDGRCVFVKKPRDW